MIVRVVTGTRWDDDVDPNRAARFAMLRAIGTRYQWADNDVAMRMIGTCAVGNWSFGPIHYSEWVIIGSKTETMDVLRRR